MTQVTSSTKVTLNRLGVFTVSSFHAYICARSPSLLNNLLAGRGATKRRAPALNSGAAAGGRSNSCTAPSGAGATGNTGGVRRRSLSNAGGGGGGAAGAPASVVLSPGGGEEGSSKLVKVTLPDNQVRARAHENFPPFCFSGNSVFPRHTRTLT